VSPSPTRTGKKDGRQLHEGAGGGGGDVRLVCCWGFGSEEDGCLMVIVMMGCHSFRRRRLGRKVDRHVVGGDV